MERTALEEALTVECTMSDEYEAGTAALTIASETFTAAVDSRNEPIFNLCGQRVTKPKGLVIKGGKAYLVK